MTPSVVSRVDERFKSVFENCGPEKQKALARYFLPRNSQKACLAPTRPRVVKWYCPFACQKTFPSGHRYCINVYTGCCHSCVYCYAAGYAPGSPSSKAGFERLLAKDLGDLENFAVPPAPVHLSNSTDPFQKLERQYGHTRFALEKILQARHRTGRVGGFQPRTPAPATHARAADAGLYTNEKPIAPRRSEPGPAPNVPAVHAARNSPWQLRCLKD